MRSKYYFGIVFFIALTLSFSTSALAVGSGGFENASFSAISLAQGNAVVAQGEEPATISYNPAAITDLPGIQTQYNAGFVSLFHFYDGDNGQPDTRSSGTLVHIPSAYLTINPGQLLNDRLAFGVGVDAPFGLSNKYDSRHPIVRYTSGASNWIKMFSIKPVAALKINDKLSIGAGPVWYRAFSVGTITQYPNFFIVPGSPDGQLRGDLSGNRWGWHAGAKLKLTEKHHFGFYFRSPTILRLRGQLDLENPVLASNEKVGARAKLNLPMNFTVGYAFHPNEKTTVEMDLGWTKWSGFKRIQVHNDPFTSSAIGAINAGHNALTATLLDGQGDYHDTFSLHLGGKYDVTDRLTLRGGTHFYWTPLPKHHFRPNLPDANSLGLALGMSYEMFRNFHTDLVYYNRFWFERDVDNPISENVGTSVDGSYFSYGQQFIIGVRYLWDAFGKDEADYARIEKKQREKENKVEETFWQGNLT